MTGRSYYFLFKCMCSFDCKNCLFERKNDLCAAKVIDISKHILLTSLVFNWNGNVKYLLTFWEAVTFQGKC